MKKFLSSVSSRNRHSLYAQIILSAFLITNLYPSSLKAGMRQNHVVEYPPFQIHFVNERDEVYDTIIDEVADYRSLAELFDNNFIYSIIDKIMANGQTSWSLVTYLEQLNATQRLDREQFRALIDKLIQEQWAEQLLGASLYRTLLEQFMERYSSEQLEQLEEAQEDLYRVVIHLLRSHGSKNDEQSSLSLSSKSRGFFRLITPMVLNVLTSDTGLGQAVGAVNNIKTFVHPNEREGNGSKGKDQKSGFIKQNKEIIWLSSLI